MGAPNLPFLGKLPPESKRNGDDSSPINLLALSEALGSLQKALDATRNMKKKVTCDEDFPMKASAGQLLFSAALGDNAESSHDDFPGKPNLGQGPQTANLHFEVLLQYV